VTLRELVSARARRLVVGFVALVLVSGGVAGLFDKRVGEGSVLQSAPPRLGDLWSGGAELVLDKKWTFASLGERGGGAVSGAHVEVVGDTWYLFSRRTYRAGCPGQGGNSRQMGTQVRLSTDRGANWGPPTTILAPTPGTPWACAATDGDATYDPTTATWRYMFQCMGADPTWNGCYAERHDASPLGPFSAPAADFNPVITSGELWSRICDDPGDACGGHSIYGEGTFDVFTFDGQGWWVGFHGFDGTDGYRGIARTTTFRRGEWQVDGEGGTPTDVVIDANDAVGWRETWREGGPIGAGAASVLEQDGWYYQLAEVPDTSLACTQNQTWDLGLFRTQQLSSTAWEQLPAGNPVVYSERTADGKSPACNVIYPRLFSDPATGTTYLMFGRGSVDSGNDALYVYRLEWNRNLLVNGSFWSADTTGWAALAGTPTQLSAERTPDGSPDGTPYLAFGCGTPTCDASQTVHQDVHIDPGLAGKTVAFGGAFRSGDGAGDVAVGLIQFDAAGAVIGAQGANASLGAAYAPVRGTATIDPGARMLRFQFSPLTPGTFGADNLYVIPQDGCTAPQFPAC
jgi:hypothetical protein